MGTFLKEGAEQISCYKEMLSHLITCLIKVLSITNIHILFSSEQKPTLRVNVTTALYHNKLSSLSIF